MPMIFNHEKKVFELGYSYIEAFVEKYKKTSQWNETQLHLMVETLVNCIDVVTENFMLNGGYLGNAIWIFEQLKNINNYMKNKGYYLLDKNDIQLKKLRSPLHNYRHLMGQYKYQPKWIGEIEETLPQSSQLCLGWFGYTGVNLERFQAEELTDEQNEQAHIMIDEILTEAITTLKQSKAYQKAARSNRLYYDILADLPEAELKDLSSEQLKDLPLPKKESPLTNQTKMMLFKQKPVPMKQETQTTAVKRKATDKLKQDENSVKYIVNVKKQKLNT